MNKIALGTFQATPKMQQLVNQVLDTGRLSYGQMSREFESRFAQMHNCQYGVLSNSGTSSLLVALQTLKEMHGWPDGSEVIIPAITFVATVNVVLHLRLKPVLVDVDSRYYDLDYTKIEAAINENTKCIIPVHIFGQASAIDELSRTVAPFAIYGSKIKVIEDSCEAMLVTRFGYPVGSFGDISCFSTYMAHILVTGVGGLGITDNPEYALYMRSLVNHGIDLNELPTGQHYDHTWLGRKFDFKRVGHSFRMTELEAALGLAQLDDLPEIISHRQENAAYLTEHLASLEDRLQLPAIRSHSEHAFQMYPLVCRQEGTRNNLRRFLAENGIESRLALPLTRQPCYQGLWEPDDYPVADWVNRNGLYIGCHQGLNLNDLSYIVEKFRDFFNLN